MNFSPTAWGWLTIAFGAASMFSIFLRWRVRRQWMSVILLLSVLLFLFSFMQWASWYK